jgi:hypothetical protein
MMICRVQAAKESDFSIWDVVDWKFRIRSSVSSDSTKTSGTIEFVGGCQTGN